jgi:uncharacterized phage infection (PIP) family protein YhgE
MPAIAAAPIALAVIGGVASGAASAALRKPAADAYDHLKGKHSGDEGGAKATAAAGQMQPRAGLPDAEGQPQAGGLKAKLEQGMGKLKEGAQELKSALDTGQPIKSALGQGGQKIESAQQQKTQELQAMLQGIRA